MQINKPNNRMDYMSLGKTIAQGTRWRLEYSQRHDGKFNVWMPTVDLHQDRTCDIYWEVVAVCDDVGEARSEVIALRKKERP